jgi:soluble lytic murein transglycosylase-like protein
MSLRAKLLSLKLMFRSLAAAAVLCLLTPSLALAQIYSWRDASGRLILSDKPKDPSAKVYAVSSSSAVSGFRVTKAGSSQRAALYDELILQEAGANSLSPDFVRAVIQAESAFNPWARSTKGAMGLMQLMPQTAAEFRVVNAYDPAENIRAGAAYLRNLLDRYDNDPKLALAAYNAGPNAVDKYGRAVPPYKETRAYVARIQNSQAAAEVNNHRIFRITQVVDGHQVVRFTDKPVAGATVVK